MSALDYAGTKLVGVRQVDDGSGVSITRLSGTGELRLTNDEWDDLVHLAVLFIRRARGEL